jgi:hypothetical protein
VDVDGAAVVEVVASAVVGTLASVVVGEAAGLLDGFALLPHAAAKSATRQISVTSRGVRMVTNLVEGARPGPSVQATRYCRPAKLEIDVEVLVT